MVNNFAEKIHMEIHALRRIAGYKPTPAEINISRFVIEEFKDKCDECKIRGEQLKNTPQKKGIIDSIMGRING